MKPSAKIAKEATISLVGMGFGNVVRYVFTALLARLIGAHYLGVSSLGRGCSVTYSNDNCFERSRPSLEYLGRFYNEEHKVRMLNEEVMV